MAEMLKRQFGIVVLKVQLRRNRSGDEEVIFTVQHSPNGLFTESPEMAYPAKLICTQQPQVADTLPDPEAAFQLPEAVLQPLAAWMDSEFDHEQPLWVHLVSPYGLLRFVSWELQLGLALKRPVLMLPDFLFRQPKESAGSLDVVVCGSAPAYWEGHFIQVAIADAIRAISAIQRDRVNVHVFVDHPTRASVEQALEGIYNPAFRVNFYSPLPMDPTVQRDEMSSEASGESQRTSWLNWMKSSLKSRSVDVVHFICHGHLSDRRGGLQFSKYPLDNGRSERAVPVAADEVLSFLTQVGAWSAVFTSVRDNTSRLGLRALADEIAQTRPGPMMMHAQGVGTTDDLADAYRFLFSPEVPIPPRSPGLFIYCQPYLAAPPAYLSSGADEFEKMNFTQSSVARNSEQQRVATLASAEPAFESFFKLGGDIPSEIAATERFAEQVELKYQKLARDGVTSSGRSSAADTVFDTVNKLRSAVASLTSKRGL